jgi:sugar transferase (PEP-CTERM system associated)
MIRLFHVYFPSRTLLLAGTELLLITAALLAAVILRFHGDVELALLYEGGVLRIGTACLVLMLCMHYYDLYNSPVLCRPAEAFTRLVQVLGTTSVILAGIYYVYPQVQLGRAPFIIWIILAGLILAGWRRLFFALNKSAKLSHRTVLLGSGPMATSLSSEIELRPELGLNLLGYVGTPDDDEGGLNGLRHLCDIQDLSDLVERDRVTRIILTDIERCGRLPVDLLLKLKARGTVFQDAADVYEAVTGRLCLDALRPSWLLFANGFCVSPFTLFQKRMASIILSSISILLSAPLMALIALAIRLDSPGPAIFRQKRVGKDGKIFTMYKFRSMWLGADADGDPRPATDNDERVTRVGRRLRRMRLDELPQLFNIFKGDMYFIGPRPFVPNMEEELIQKIPFYAQRSIVKPGATGWAQIRRGYCATVKDNVEKLGYDLFYIKHLSFGLDFLILFETLKILVLGRGGR